MLTWFGSALRTTLICNAFIGKFFALGKENDRICKFFIQCYIVFFVAPLKMALKIKSTIFTWFIFYVKTFVKKYIYINLIIKEVWWSTNYSSDLPEMFFDLICFCSHELSFSQENCKYILTFKFKYFPILLYRTYFLFKVRRHVPRASFSYLLVIKSFNRNNPVFHR